MKKSKQKDEQKEVFMTIPEVREDTQIKNWLCDIGAARNTSESYIEGMQQFTQCVKKTPLELIEEAEAEIKAGLLLRERSIGEYLRLFKEELENRKVAPLTMKSRINSVCAFFTHYDIQLPNSSQRSVKKAKPQLKRINKITKEDIQALLDHADELERAIILTGVASGLAANELINLKVRDFHDGYDPETGITTLHLIREKTEFEFYTFLTPEASRAVQAYLDYRSRKSTTNRTAQIDQLRKQRVLKDKDGKPSKSGYLFVKRIVPDEWHKTKNQIEKEEMRKLDTSAIMAMYRRLCEEAQVATERGEWNTNRSHNTRKYFFNTLNAVISDKDKLEYMMAHEVEGTKKHYKWSEDSTELLELYKQHMHLLVIEKEFDPATSTEFKLMQKENEKLAKIASTAVVEREEITKLKQENEDLRITLQSQDREWEQVIEHLVDERIGDYKKEVAEIFDKVLKIDWNKPLTEEEKKNLPDW
jgi:integrase